MLPEKKRGPFDTKRQCPKKKILIYFNFRTGTDTLLMIEPLFNGACKITCDMSSSSLSLSFLSVCIMFIRVMLAATPANITRKINLSKNIWKMILEINSKWKLIKIIQNNVFRNEISTATAVLKFESKIYNYSIF